MKVQWQLILIDDGKVVAKLGDPFNFNAEELAIKFADQYLAEQCKGEQQGSEPPKGIL